MKVSVLDEAQFLPKQYRDDVVRLAFQPPANPNRPASHIYAWLYTVQFNADFSLEDRETVERICQIVSGNKVPPRQKNYSSWVDNQTLALIVLLLVALVIIAI